MRTSLSPWSRLQQYATVTIEPFRGPINGHVTPPGSKSATNRALIIAAAARGTSTIHNMLRSDDSYWCLEALRQLGLAVVLDGNDVSISSNGGWKKLDEPLFVGSAGTVARFLTSLLSLTAETPVRIHASSQMSQRPMRPLFEALSTLGGQVEYEGERFQFPVALGPTEDTRASSVHIAGSQSSQFLSGLLIATPRLKKSVVIQVDGSVVQASYVKITLDIMKHFGVRVEPDRDFRTFPVVPTPYTPADYSVEPDASTASYFFGLAAITGGEITISGLSASTLQPDIEFLSVLQRMGCTVQSANRTIVVKGPEKLRGGFSIDMKAFSDTALTLAALAPFADAPIEITGVAHIRGHESDRIHAMVTELTKAGVPVQENEDGLRIQPARPRRTSAATYDDHRMAMSLALVGLGGSGMIIENPACVSKTCPQFFDELRRLEVDVVQN